MGVGVQRYISIAVILGVFVSVLVEVFYRLHDFGEEVTHGTLICGGWCINFCDPTGSMYSISTYIYIVKINYSCR